MSPASSVTCSDASCATFDTIERARSLLNRAIIYSMRWAILLLLSGILTMADFSPQDLARALMGPAEAKGAPRSKRQPYNEADHARLSGLVSDGKISIEEYNRRMNVAKPPPGVDPHTWALKTKPVMGMGYRPPQD